MGVVTSPNFLRFDLCACPICPRRLHLHKLQPTRVPRAFREYLKAYARHHGRKLDDMCTDILTKFLICRPFDTGLVFRVPMSTKQTRDAQEDWVQLNFFLSDEMSMQLVTLTEEKNVSKAMILYTCILWFVKYMLPPQVDALGSPLPQSYAGAPS